MIFILPPLPYAMDALEPIMSEETLEYHYGKHLQTYVDNLNRLLEGTPHAEVSLEEIILSSTGPVFNNAAQVWNHTFFFNSLTPEQKPMPEVLEEALIKDFGSVKAFEEQFKKAAAGIFGSGWAWLAQDRNGKLHIIQESNAGNPMRAGFKPLLTIDVWEHAYYIDYRNKRAEFVNRCWELFDWNEVLKRMHAPAFQAGDTVGVVTETTKEGVTEAMADAIMEDEKDMRKYVCVTCGWVYEPAEGDPENGIPPGTPFSDLPDDWTCPACGVGKEYFEPER